MGKLRILVVDDDKLALRITEKGLRDHGYEVVTASSGFQALQCLASGEHRYAMVLMDRLLGDMNGQALIPQLRALPHCASMPVIVMTSQAAPEEYIACIEQGVEDFFYKPVDQRLLCHMINKASHWVFRDNEIINSI